MNSAPFMDSIYFPSALRQFTGKNAWARAKGSYIWTSDDKCYLDCTSAFGVSLFGHSHQSVSEAVSVQANMLPHAMSSIYPHIFEHDALYGIARHSPINDPAVVLTSSGSEAVEVALKVAFLATGRSRVAYLDGGYHGQSLGALRVIGQSSLRNPLSKIIANDSICISFPFPGDTDEQITTSLSELVNANDGVDKLGAIIVEPMQNPAGYRILPTTYCLRLSDFCKKNNILVIADEVFTGFGRSGYWSLSQQIGLDADIYCFGKAMTGGIPAGACVGSRDLLSMLATNSGIPLHSPTFLGNPIVCAAVNASIRVLESENIPQRSQDAGAKIKNAFSRELKDSSIVADVRGSGCAIAIQFVNTICDFPGSLIALSAVERLRSHGILALNSGFPAGNVLSITPSAIIDNGEINSIIEGVMAVHSDLLQEVGGHNYG